MIDSKESLFGDWSRRRFVRTVVVGAGSSMVIGQPWEGTLVATVKAAGDPGIGTLRLKAADFPPLLATFGSVRLGFQALNPSGPVVPFIVTKDGDQYLAVSSECTHASCTIPAFTSAKVSTCPCHGSRFAPDGRVLRGPAVAALNVYNVEVVEPGILQITIPEFPPYQVTIEQVASATKPRVALVFPSLKNMQYEVVAAASAAGPWKARTFASTPEGTANLTVFTGTGAEARVYVDRDAESGLFSVATKIRQV